MKRFLTWLKEWRKPADQPAGPDEVKAYLVKELKAARELVDRMAAQQEALRKQFDASDSDRVKASVRAAAEMEQLRAKLTRPFEARETAAAPPWEDEDRNNLRIFLGTNTGQRLTQGLNYWAQFKEQAATLTTENQAYQCGTAAGYRHFGTFVLHTLSADIRPQQDEDTRTRHGADDLRERHAP